MANVRGVEHVGMTVPNMEEAEAFFMNAFDAEVLYRVLPKSADDQSGEEVGAINGMPEDNAQRAISMLRMGGGANLELFEVSRPTGEPARICSLGLTHFSIVVDDIEAAGRAAKAAGATMFDGPQDCFDAESGPGNKLWFFHTPWGTLVEMLQLPSEMTYREGATKTRFIPSQEA
ncbi:MULTISPECIES: VOC family protein [unclassified Halomonas]|uniref:VOC family protein n=1 Tax=unclassified Halomonas TaxID=2609666 RepID=UPI00209F47BF|nr:MULTISPECIES: VOC family protein [unclassified Halomonas]MCP1315215.1 VOC family protein [Halomonas sp. 707D7]MCP1326422.1 VOC family protein [Halomonas sp. 707D4]